MGRRNAAACLPGQSGLPFAIKPGLLSNSSSVPILLFLWLWCKGPSPRGKVPRLRLFAKAIEKRTCRECEIEWTISFPHAVLIIEFPHGRKGRPGILPQQFNGPASPQGHPPILMGEFPYEALKGCFPTTLPPGKPIRSLNSD